MNSITGIIIALFVLSAVFFILGSSFCCIFGTEETTAFEYLSGFVIFLTVFALIEIPIELSGMAFHVLVYAETAVFVIILTGCITYLLRQNRKNKKIIFKKPDQVTIILFVLILLQIFYGMNNGSRINGYDTSYYNGHAANALYTDTIYQYDARTGEYIGQENYVHDCYPMLIAFLARIFGMHPLVASSRVLACVEILTASLIVYEIARRLSDGRRDIADWTVGIYGFMSILCYEFEETSAFYLWQRTAESKSMLANLYLPMVLLAMVLLAKNIESKRNWLILCLIAFAGVSMSISGIFIITVMVGAGLLSVIFVQKKWRYLFRAFVCMIPGIVMAMIRIL